MIACILPLTGSLQLQAGLAMGMPPNATPRAGSLSTPGSPDLAACQRRLKPDPLLTLGGG